MEGNTGRPKIGLRNRIYKLVERRLGPENLDIILTDDIDGMLLTACFDAWSFKAGVSNTRAACDPQERFVRPAMLFGNFQKFNIWVV